MFVDKCLVKRDGCRNSKEVLDGYKSLMNDSIYVIYLENSLTLFHIMTHIMTQDPSIHRTKQNEMKILKSWVILSTWIGSFCLILNIMMISNDIQADRFCLKLPLRFIFILVLFLFFPDLPTRFFCL